MQGNRLKLKCVAMVGDFFLKTNEVILFQVALIHLCTRWALSGLECWKADMKGKKTWKWREGRRRRAWGPGGWGAPPPPPSSLSGSLLRAQNPTTGWECAAAVVEEGEATLAVNLPPNVSSSSSAFSVVKQNSNQREQFLSFDNITIFIIIGIKASGELA